MKTRELRAFLEEKGIDFALFYSAGMGVNPNFRYFSGFNGPGALLAGKDTFLLVPKMEEERARKCNIRNVYPIDKKRLFESVLGIVKKKKLRHKKIGIDKNSFTLNAYKGFRKCFKSKISDISGCCARLRTIKTDGEIKLLAKSCSHADKIIQKCIRNFKDFRTESEAAAFLVYETKKNGLELSFSPIVASGKNASMPHYEPSSSRINKGFCVIDFGVQYKGYCSDITRTVYIGNPSLKEKNIYNKLLQIQKNAIDIVKDNKKCSELYDFTVKSLGKDAKYFTHGLGHGIGVEIHELPNLTLNSKDRIRDNMVFTIEPGIYVKGKFGIRIEDSLMFSGRAKVLTRTSKDLLII